VCLCCILPLVVFGGIGIWGWSKAKGLVGCSISFTTLQRSIKDYANDHDGKLPKASTWESDIKSYYTQEVTRHPDEKMFGSGSQGQSIGCTNADGPTTGIAFNSALSGKKLADVSDPTGTVMLFEVPTAGSNLNSEYKPQPYTTSPKIVNSPRGWYICHVQGAPVLMTPNGPSKSFDMGSKGGGSD
jgi:hypothetical protein